MVVIQHVLWNHLMTKEIVSSVKWHCRVTLRCWQRAETSLGQSWPFMDRGQFGDVTFGHIRISLRYFISSFIKVVAGILVTVGIGLLEVELECGPLWKQTNRSEIRMYAPI